MAQPQPAPQQIHQALIGNAFGQLTVADIALDSHDQFWSDQDVLTLFQNMTTVNNQDFHGFTPQQFATVLSEFATNCAQEYANSKTNWRTNGGTGGGPRRVLYNRIRDKINDQSLSISALCATYATQIYNTLTRLQRPPSKWQAKGFKDKFKYVAFPGAIYIDAGLATTPLPEGWREAVLANRDAVIYASSSTTTESLTTSAYFTGGKLQTGSVPHRPGQLLLTQG